jgi:diadenosine tetraphosphatase ApaH/serine/threonine PP2A family protein phosphatase
LKLKNVLEPRAKLMDGGSMSMDDFASQAKTVSGADFLVLIKRVTLLLKKEQRCAKSKSIEGRLVRLKPSGKATIIGDLHGDSLNFVKILKESGFFGRAKKGENVRLIFLGDYGDRGFASPEVYFLVLKMKEFFPEKVVLMKGNHEGPEDMLPVPYDLPVQFERKYGELGEKIMIELRRLFKRLYTVVIIDERAVLVHGGLPAKTKSVRCLAYAHSRHPKETCLEEMLWSDPEEELQGVVPSPRNAGKLFGTDVTERFLHHVNVPILIRGHQSCDEGYKSSHNGRILTLFSTNHLPYTNKHAAYLQIDLSEKIANVDQLKVHIKQF